MIMPAASAPMLLSTLVTAFHRWKPTTTTLYYTNRLLFVSSNQNQYGFKQHNTCSYMSVYNSEGISDNNNGGSTGNRASIDKLLSSHNNAFQLRVSSSEEMETVGGILSHISTVGDVILLGGELGAGKTCWARGFIRSMLDDKNLRVTSPTYLLSNTYTCAYYDDDNTTSYKELSIHHMDLYRLAGPEELQPLDLDHVFKSCISLIEWPDRLGLLLEERIEKYDQNVLFCNIFYDNAKDSEGSRIVELQPRGSGWKERLQYLLEEEDEGLTNFLI